MRRSTRDIGIDDFMGGEKVDSLFLQRSLEGFPHLAVEVREDLIHHLHDGDPGTEALPDAPQLEADNATPDDEEMFGNPGEGDSLIGGDNGVSVKGESGYL